MAVGTTGKRRRHSSGTGTPVNPAARLPEPAAHDVFDGLAHQVESTPDHVGLDDGEMQLSYRETWDRAGVLAEHLAAQGVGAGDPVVVAGPRSAAFVVALLGSLRAGAVAVPLSTMFPVSRTAAMVREAGARHALVVGASPAWADDLAVIHVAQDGHAAEPGLARATPAPWGEHATISFTSGSTGVPKAVLGTHTGLATLAAWYRSTFAITSADRTSLTTNVGFVTTLRNVFGTLTAGATLCIAPDLLLPEDALDWVARSECTVLHTTATTARTWLAERTPGTSRPRLRWTVFAGEPLPDTVVAEWRAAVDGSGRVANAWGATELGGTRAWYEVPDPAPGGVQPVHEALPGTQLLIVAEDGALCDVDEPGELLVRARDLPVGYANDPGASARCFIANPFSRVPGDRVVRTGDRALRRADGTIAIIGRLDDVVKLGGFRIDAGDVASLLRAHPAVREAYVIPHENEDGSTVLAAFVVLEDVAVDVDALRTDLRRRCGRSLPVKAVPARIDVLDTPPLTDAGKLDRRRLLGLLDEPAEARHDPRPDPTATLPDPPQATLLDDVESWVRSAPTHVALDDGTVTATYEALWAHAGDLAALLAAQGVTTGTPVMVTGPRGTAFGIAMLGVLRAGAVVVPCASMLPDARCASMAGEVAATHVVSIGDPPAWTAGRTTLVLDDAGAPRDRAMPRATPAAPGEHAYVFFTSGTTGAPKAVLGRHASLAAYLRWWRETFDVDARDRVSMVTSTAFDVTLRNLFGPLVSGATVCVAPDGLLPEDGLRWLADARVSVLHVTPSLAASWLAEAPTDATEAARPALRWTLFAGEMLTDVLVQRWRAATTGAIGNMYGPTETTMSRCLAVIGDEPVAGAQPVGFALAGSQVLVVDEHDRLCAVGEPGEVLVRTRAGTAGYANNATEHAARFVTNPFTGDPADVVYRTGDRGWYREDGSLQLAGRIDDQVKIGGVRVEPAEVTSALVAHPDVRAAHVQARTGHAGEPELVAFVVTDAANEARASITAALRRHLGGVLAPAAIPARVVHVDRLPMTPNGKVDRVALLALVDAPAVPAVDPVVEPVGGPATPVPAPSLDLDEMVQVWRTVLRRDDVHADTNFFDAGGSSVTAVRLGHRLRERAGRAVAILDLLDAQTPRELLALLAPSPSAAPPVALPSAPAVHRVIAAHAETRPAAPAIDVDGTAITYASLERRVRAAARLLVDEGVVPGSLVAIHAARTATLVPLLLAVHRAGAGYVPLDPDLPAARLAFVLEDAAPSIVVTDRPLPAAAAAHRTLTLDLVAHVMDGAAASDATPTDVVVDDDPARVAYVIYTSGSTGHPKGVLVPQRGLRSFVDAANRRYDLCADDRLLQYHSLSFDTSVEEIFCTLAAGATLVTTATPLLGSAGWFLEQIEAMRITVLDLPTAFWTGLTEDLDEGDLHLHAGLRAVVVGGSAASADAVNRFNRRTGGAVALINAYGPTECTIAATAVDLSTHRYEPGELVTIGPALDGVTTLVLDADGRAVADDEPGELLLGGAQLALGYLNRPELTAERFVVDPTGATSDRYYRTGDRVRRRSDGSFVFEARVDDQVKIRGYRFELGEVEAALMSHPGVREAVALLETGDGPDPRLVAHVVLRDGADPSVDELRAHAATLLPSYAVPVHLERRTALPRTPGGKPDRRALRAGTRAPLGFAQEQQWFLHKFDPTSTAYNLTCTLRVRGPLDHAALDRALQALAERHESLRTRVVELDDAPVQVIDEPAPVAIERVDAMPQDAEALDDTARRTLRACTSQPFDLERGPLYRPLVVRLADDDHLVALRFHHIVVDGWSTDVLVDELLELYCAGVEGRAPALDADVVQPRTLALAERAAEADGSVARAVDRVVARLSPVGAPLTLPLDRARPAVRDDVGHTVRGAAAPGSADRMRAVARELHTTPYAVGLALWAEFLASWCAADDVLVATPSVDRDLAGSDRTVGMLVNALAMRLRPHHDDTVRRAVQDATTVARAALADKAAPFDRVVRALQPVRVPGMHPLVQTMFQVIAPPGAPRDVAGLLVEPFLAGRNGAKFDAAADLVLGDELICRLVLAADVFTTETASQVCERFVAFVDAALAAPDRTMDEVRAAVGLAAPPVTSTPRPPAPARPAVAATPVVGRHATAVAAIMGELLGRELAPDDDFFASGGHSLLAVKLCSVVERRLGVRLGIASVFASPTPRGLGVVLGDEPGAPSPTSAAPTGAATAPLTPAQARVWLQEQLDGDTQTYRELLARRLRGPLHAHLLRRAIDVVVERHEPLRSRVVTTDDGPVQVVDAPGPVAWRTVDRTGLADGAAREAAVDDELAVLGRERLDIAEGPMLRGALVQLADDDHALLVSVHHLVFDGPAADLFVGELTAVYDALVHGRTPELPALTTRYTDFARRQVEHLDDGGADADLAWWADALASLAPAPALPDDHAPDPRDRRGGTARTVTVALGQDVDDAVAALARRLGTTRQRVGSALFFAFLHEITGTDDLVLGLSVGERTDDALRPLIGFFVNTLPIRARIAPGTTLEELAAQVHRATEDALAHRSAPFDRIVAAVRARDGRVPEPFLAASFDYRRPMRTQAIEAGGVQFTRVRKPDTLESGAKFPVDVTIDRVADGALLRFRYDQARFESTTAERLARRFVALMVAALAAPDRPLDAARPSAAAPASTSTDLVDVVRRALGEVLGRPIGPDDDFFGAGGHSLLAVRACSRLERALGRRVAVATLFAHPTARGIAAAIDGDASTPRATEARTAPEPEPAAAPAAPDAPDRTAGPEHAGFARPVRLHLRRAPLSFAQRRLWALEQLGEAGAAYILTSAYDLHGVLDLDALRVAMQSTAHRHEVLRTRYVLDEATGEPEQIVDRPVDPEIVIHDLRRTTPRRDRGEIDALVRREARRAFDLATEHPWRAVVARVADGHSVLAVAVHHIATDGESQGTILRDLVRAYNAATRGETGVAPELRLQYADHAVWQQARAASGALDASLAHWEDVHRPLPEPLRLPGARGIRPSGSGALLQVRAGAARLARVVDFARAHRTTTFTVLLTAYELLLHELTARTDLVVGIPATERSMDGDEETVGFFVNTLPLRLRVDPRAAVQDLVRTTQLALVDALAHADAPLDLVVERLEVARDASTPPLVQTMFSVQDAPGDAPRFDGLLTRRRRLGDSATAKFDLSLIASVGEELDLWFEHRDDVLDGVLVEQWSAQYLRTLDALLDAPGTPVAALAHLAPDTEAWLVEGCNRTRTAYPRERTVHELFDEIADTRPDAVAIVDGTRSRTYAELRTDADALAAELRAAGVGAGDRVAVEMGRSLELVIAMLAVLRTGAAYVPVDPTYPEARRAMMRDLARAAAAVVLADGALAVRPGPGRDTTTVPADVRADDAAYVMFTSGSTGTPKGVVVPHRAIVRLVRDTDYVGHGPDLVLAHLSNTSFDAATFEIWGALLNGARLVVLDTDTVTSPAAFAEAIRRHGVTTMFVTTALFNVMAREVPGAFATVRDLLFGGEAADPHAVRAVLADRPPSRLVNVYGPTESTTFASWHLVEHLDDDATTVPIGRPIANTTLHVVDAHGRPAPPLVEGELLIGGDGLAIGYLDDEAMTAARFVPDPFAATPQARLYRTGDIVRRRMDGAIELVGRRDHQVKIRGFRIELGDVEASLRALGGVDAVHVLTRRAADGDVELLAYVVPAAGVTLEGDVLRDALRATRPAYLVPSAVIVLDALPINANGKIDRDALPAPVAAERASTDAGLVRAAPADALEAAIAEIWSEVLERDDFGVEDNFFEVGGNSIRAVRVFAAVDRATGVRLGLSALFEAPTVRALATLVRAARPTIDTTAVTTAIGAVPAGADESLFVTLRAGDPVRRVPVYLVHPAGGQVFAYAKLLPALAPDHPVIGIREHAWHDPARRLPTIEAYAEHYAAALEAHQPKGPLALGGYSLGGLLAYEMARLLRARGRDVRQVLLLDATPFGAYATGDVDEAKASKLRRRFARDGVRGVLGGVGRVVHRRWDRTWTWPAAARRDRRAFRAAQRDGGDLDPILLGRISERGGQELRRVYRPAPYEGRVVFFNATGTDPDFPIPSGAAGWHGIADDVVVIDVPGNHANEGSMMTEPYVQELARQFAEALAADERGGR